MRAEILPDADAVAKRAAQLIAAEARAAVTARGQFTLAASGGRTPWQMLRALAATPDVPWGSLHVVQVDERIAPLGHADRNLTLLLDVLVARGPLERSHLHAMPVEDAELTAAAARYAAELRELAGSPPAPDLVQLGLGSDGHTASLVPGDPVLHVTDLDVAITAEYQGRKRMTLTYPLLERARSLLWVVTGAEKAPAVARLRAGDRGIPAGRVPADRALLLLDAAAADARGDTSR